MNWYADVCEHDKMQVYVSDYGCISINLNFVRNDMPKITVIFRKIEICT